MPPLRSTARRSRARRGAARGFAALLLCALPRLADGQTTRAVDLTLESAVQMTIDDSYRVRRLRLEVDRTRSLLVAQRAGLKSRVYMNFAAPDFERVSEAKWNSTLQRNEIVMERADLSQRQRHAEPGLLAVLERQLEDLDDPGVQEGLAAGDDDVPVLREKAAGLACGLDDIRVLRCGRPDDRDVRRMHVSSLRRDGGRRTARLTAAVRYG